MNLSPSLAPVLTGTALPPGDGFYPALAEAIVGQGVAHGLVGDLSSLRVLLPALPMAAELRPALARAAGRPMLLPQFSTFSLWAQTVDPSGLPAPLAATALIAQTGMNAAPALYIAASAALTFWCSFLIPARPAAALPPA